MKKFTKVCLIAGGVCVLIGGGITTVAAAMGGSLYDTPLYHYNTFGREIGNSITGEIVGGITDGIAGEISREISDGIRDGVEDFDWDQYEDDFDEDDYRLDSRNANSYSSEFSQIYARKLEVEVRRGRVVILDDSDSDEITVSSDLDRSYWSAYSEGDELKVKIAPKTWDGKDYSDAVVYVHVPKEYRFDEAELKVKALRRKGISYHGEEGPVIIAENLQAGKLELEAEVGSIAVTGADVGKLDVQSDVGALEFVGNVDGSVEAECSVGAIKLDLNGKKTDYNYEIKSRVGSVTVDGESFAGLSNEKKIDNKAAKKMELECSTGAVVVKFHESL